jgi:hypothetical protein
MEVGGVRLEGKEVAVILAGLGLDDPNPNSYKGSLVALDFARSFGSI